MTDVATATNGQVEGDFGIVRPKTKEDPNRKFRRIASRRTQQVLVSLSRLSNTASSAYSYTDGEVARMLETIDESVQRLHMAFQQRRKVDTDFRF